MAGMRKPVLPFLLASIPLSLIACGGSEPMVKAPTTPSVAESASVEAPPDEPESTRYAGFGLGSVAKEVLAKYPPLPLASETARRIQSMLDLRSPGVGRVSPDGERLYFTWSLSGSPQAYRLDGPERFPVQLTGGEDSTSVVATTPDGKWLVISRDRNGEEQPGLYLQDALGGGQLVPILHEPLVRTRFEFVTRDSAYVYFAANDRKKDSFAIYRYDIANKQREVVFEQDGLWSVADYRDDGRLLLSKATGSLWAEIWEWDPKAKRLSPIIGQGEKEEHDVAYGAKEGEIFVRTSKIGDFRRVYRLEGGKLEPVTPELGNDVSAFSIDRGKTRILYQVNERGYSKVRAIDARTLREIAMPKLPDADRVLLGQTTVNGRYTSLGIDDGRHPLSTWVIDWTSGKLTKWLAPSVPELDASRFARATLESYPARDGTEIPVFIRMPEKCKTESCPVIVRFHGGPESQSVAGFNLLAQMYVDAGFILCDPNVRGSDGYGKAWLRADDGPKRLDVITDIEDAAKWARERFAKNGEAPKLGVLGGSYGGYSTLMAMTKFAGAYDAGVSIVGISNLVTFLENTAPYRRMLRISEYGDPEKDRDALVKLSPTTYVDRVKGPLLILQGATDPRVPAGEAVQIRDALAKKGIPAPLMIFPDEGHGASKRSNQVLMFGHSISFFQEHLGEGSQK